ncbi:MAG: hypothetical protein QOD66_4019 [Solirubrobacteraceae bacterium]|jgi:hypothetical protein|nr:hypothetical protein [Solirubrobacteraceae bacterium]
MRSKAQKWLAAGVALGTLGIVVAILGMTVPGIILVAAAVADLVIIALGYPSPRDLRHVSRTLYKDEDPADHDPDEAFVSVALSREKHD